MSRELVERRKFRPNHRDVECFIEDDFGVVRPIYVRLPANIDKTVASVVAQHDDHCRAIQKCLTKHGMEEHIERAKEEVKAQKEQRVSRRPASR